MNLRKSLAEMKQRMCNFLLHGNPKPNKKKGNKELPGSTIISPHTSSWLYLALQGPCYWCWAAFAQWLKHRTNNPHSFVVVLWLKSVSGRNAGSCFMSAAPGEDSTCPPCSVFSSTPALNPRLWAGRGLLRWKQLLGQFTQHKAELCCGHRGSQGDFLQKQLRSDSF